MTYVVAHRGASAACPPGNTVEAFHEAVVEGAEWVELDVHLTADGEIVVRIDAAILTGAAAEAWADAETAVLTVTEAGLQLAPEAPAAD